MTQAHPYEQITPDMVLDAIDSTGFLTDARILALRLKIEPRLPSGD